MYVTGIFLNALFTLLQSTLPVIPCVRHDCCYLFQEGGYQGSKILSNFPEATVSPLLSAGAKIPTISCAPKITVLHTLLNHFPVFCPIWCNYLTFYTLSTSCLARSVAILHQENTYFSSPISFAVLIAPPSSHHTVNWMHTILHKSCSSLLFLALPSSSLCLSVVKM